MVSFFSPPTWKNETLHYSQLSDGNDTVCGLPSDTFFVSSCWSNTTKQNKYLWCIEIKETSGGVQGVLTDTKPLQKKLPVLLRSLAPAGQTKGHHLRPCLHLLSSYCSLGQRGSSLQGWLLALWLLQCKSFTLHTDIINNYFVCLLMMFIKPEQLVRKSLYFLLQGDISKQC